MVGFELRILLYEKKLGVGGVVTPLLVHALRPHSKFIRCLRFDSDFQQSLKTSSVL